MDDTTRRIIRAYYQGLAAPERRAYEELLALEPGARAERVAELLGLGWDIDKAARQLIETIEPMTAEEVAALFVERAAAQVREGILDKLGRVPVLGGILRFLGVVG